MSQMEDAINGLSEDELDLLNSDPQMLAAFKAKYSTPEGLSMSAPKLMGDLTPSMENTNVTNQGTETHMEPFNTMGKGVEAGYAGVGDLVSGNGMQQAAQDVHNVMDDKAPETMGGKVGKGFGSFFTPAQIAFQAIGGALAKPIANLAGNITAPIVKIPANWMPGASKFFGGSAEAIGALADNPSAVAKAESIPDVVKAGQATIEGLKTGGIAASDAAKSTLSATKEVPGVADGIKSVMKALDKGIHSSPATKESLAYVENVLKELPDKPTEKLLGEYIENLKPLDFEKANPSPLTQANQALTTVYSNLLKAQNPAYAEGMAKSTASFPAQDALIDALKLKEGVPTDSTYNAVLNALNPKKLGAEAGLDALSPEMAARLKNTAANTLLNQTLGGKVAMKVLPKVNPAITNAIKYAPRIENLGNSAYQVYDGLTQ